MAAIDSTNIIKTQYLLSQTPPNETKENYYLKELQDKINYEWRFRPNRVEVEYEMNPGEEKYDPIEIVLQTVKDDKGQKVADDYKKVVYKDIKEKTRVGRRFRFSTELDPNVPNEEKSIWIALNQDHGNFTASQMIKRCNGTLGSIWKDENGNNFYHYEPAIFPEDLSRMSLGHSQVTVEVDGNMQVIVQHNQYSRQYYINQRFVVGYDQIYKIYNISKQSSLTTYNPEDIGIMYLYMERVQEDKQDNFENRIAYNGTQNDSTINGDTKNIGVDTKTIRVTTPVTIPQSIISDPIDFEVYLYNGDVKTSEKIYFDFSVQNTEKKDNYVEFNVIGDNKFTVRRKRFYGNGNLIIECYTLNSNGAKDEQNSKILSFSLKEIE